MEILIFNKDNTISISNSIPKHITSLADVIGIELDDAKSSILLIKTNKFMNKMTKARINYSIKTGCTGDFDDMYSLNSEAIEKTCNSYYELALTLFNINKTLLFNTMVTDYAVRGYSYDGNQYLMINDINIDIYDNNDIIYNTSASVSNGGFIDEYFNIIFKLKDIYDQFSPTYTLQMYQKKDILMWDVFKVIDSKSFVGVDLPITDTVRFINPVFYKALYDISSLSMLTFFVDEIREDGIKYTLNRMDSLDMDDAELFLSDEASSDLVEVYSSVRLDYPPTNRKSELINKIIEIDSFLSIIFKYGAALSDLVMNNDVKFFIKIDICVDVNLHEKIKFSKILSKNTNSLLEDLCTFILRIRGDI